MVLLFSFFLLASFGFLGVMYLDKEGFLNPTLFTNIDLNKFVELKSNRIIIVL